MVDVGPGAAGQVSTPPHQPQTHVHIGRRRDALDAVGDAVTAPILWQVSHHASRSNSGNPNAVNAALPAAFPGIHDAHTAGPQLFRLPEIAVSARTSARVTALRRPSTAQYRAA